MLAVYTLICVHQHDLTSQYDLSTLDLYAGLRTSVRSRYGVVLNLYDVGLKFAQPCTHIPMKIPIPAAEQLKKHLVLLA